MQRRGVVLLALAALLPLIAGAAIRGLDPALASRYQPTADGQFACLDGSKSVPFNRVNDEYCDCADGTDEPGTSACTDGHFYCENKYFLPLRLNSSMVDDGVCDCCDGSDEPAGLCTNTCYEKGHESLIDLRQQVATAKLGVAGRNAYIHDADAAKQQWQKRKAEVERELEGMRKDKEAAEAERSRLEAEQTKLQGRKSELEAQKAKLEVPEKPAEGGEEGSDAVDADAAEAGASEQQGEGQEGGEVGEQQGEEEEQAAAQSEEELAKERMAQWIPGNKDGNGVEEEEEHAEAAAEAAEEHAAEEEALPAYDGEDLAAAEDEQRRLEAEAEAEAEAEGGQAFLGEDEGGDGDGADGADAGAGADVAGGADAGTPAAASDGAAGEAGGETEQPATAFGKAKRLLSKVLGALGGKGSQVSSGQVSAEAAELAAEISKLETELAALVAELNPVRTQATEASRKVADADKEQRELTQKLEGAYGEGDVFVPLVDRCFSAKVDKYTYEVCPFGKATQKEGHSATSLGTWHALEEGDTVMAFKNGAGCWQGPSRSMTVSLRCGQAEKLAKVAEPSRCEYTAELETPAACTPEALEALQAELKSRERFLMGTDEEEESAAAGAKDEL